MERRRADLGDLLGQAWVEINLDFIAANLRTVRSLVAPGCRLMAVVKADGYGHGSAEIAATALLNGATDLGVTRVAEAVELRRRGIGAPILVFNQPFPGEADVVVDHELSQTVWDVEVVRALSREARRRGKTATVHVKVDTGMGRYGLLPEDVLPFLEAVRGLPNLHWEGIYTHFTDGFNRGRSLKQLGILIDLVFTLASHGYDFPLKHAANSAGVVTVPESHLDMVRVGNLIYGVTMGRSDGETFRNPWRFKARVVRVQRVPRGWTVSYGSDFVARRESIIATIPVGYTDGLAMEPVTKTQRLASVARTALRTAGELLGVGPIFRLKPNGFIRLKGVPVRMAGRPCMQQCMVDVTDLDDVMVGDVAEITARRTSVSQKINRLYIYQGRPFKVRNEGGEVLLAEDSAAEAEAAAAEG